MEYSTTAHHKEGILDGTERRNVLLSTRSYIDPYESREIIPLKVLGTYCSIASLPQLTMFWEIQSPDIAPIHLHSSTGSPRQKRNRPNFALNPT